MPRILRKLKIKEISLVDKGMNPGAKVVFAKRHDDEAGKDGDIDKAIEKKWASWIAKIFKSQESKSMKDVNKQMTLEDVLATLSDDQKKVILMAMEAAAKKPDDPEKAMDEPVVPTEPEKQKEEEEELAKALAKLPAPVREKLEKADAMEKRITAMEDKESLRLSVEKAKSLQFIPGMKTEDMGKFLKSASETMSAEAFKSLEGVLKNANEAVEKSGVLSEFGSGAHLSGDAAAELEAVAKALREKDPNITVQKARQLAATQNAELYKRYLEQTGRGAN